MTFLVGQNSAFTDESQTYTVDDLIYYQPGYTAGVTGTATLAYIRVNTTLGWDNATAAKVRVHSAAGALLATATFSSAQGSGWISASLSSSVSITNGTKYYLAIITTGTGDLRLYNSGNTFECSHVNTGNYTTPPTTINAGTDGGSAKPGFNVYLDGTLAGGSLILPPTRIFVPLMSF